MSNQENKPAQNTNSLHKALNKLYRESWQMELLIMGFTIFLLATVPKNIDNLLNYVAIHFDEGVLSVLAVNLLEAGKIAVYILLFNLIADIVLRGIWIGYVGLSSVYPRGVNFNNLPYRPWYIGFFKKSFSTPQKTIIRLDQLCSQIFAFTFLIIFYIISLLFYVSELVGIALTIEYFEDNNGFLFALSIISITFLTFFGAVYFFDFITGGLLKRIKVLGKFYRYLYLFFGWITLAFLYRDIYYIILSNTNKWVFKGILLGYLTVPLLLANINFEDNYDYFYANTDTYRFANDFYNSKRTTGRKIERATIETDIVSSGFVPLFIRYDKNDNNLFNEICPEYKDFNHDAQITLMGESLGIGDTLDRKEVALKCLTAGHKVFIDSTEVPADFMFYTHPNQGEKGILAYLNVQNLRPGKHWVLVRKARKKRKNDTKNPFWHYVKIPFWKA